VSKPGIKVVRNIAKCQGAGSSSKKKKKEKAVEANSAVKDNEALVKSDLTDLLDALPQP
jgi:hypothetical protein